MINTFHKPTGFDMNKTEMVLKKRLKPNYTNKGLVETIFNSLNTRSESMITIHTTTCQNT